jgi:hypothetical protein
LSRGFTIQGAGFLPSTVRWAIEAYDFVKVSLSNWPASDLAIELEPWLMIPVDVEFNDSRPHELVL